MDATPGGAPVRRTSSRRMTAEQELRRPSSSVASAERLSSTSRSRSRRRGTAEMDADGTQGYTAASLPPASALVRPASSDGQPSSLAPHTLSSMSSLSHQHSHGLRSSGSMPHNAQQPYLLSSTSNAAQQPSLRSPSSLGMPDNSHQKPPQATSHGPRSSESIPHSPHHRPQPPRMSSMHRPTESCQSSNQMDRQVSASNRRTSAEGARAPELSRESPLPATRSSSHRSNQGDPSGHRGPASQGVSNLHVKLDALCWGFMV